MKPILLALLCLPSTYSLSAQSTANLTEPCPWGIRAAGSLSHLSGDVGGGAGGRSLGGYSLGVWVKHSLNSVLAVNAEANVSRKGDSYLMEGLINGQHYRLVYQPRLTYFAIPVTVHVHPPFFPHFNVYTGAEPAWLIAHHNSLKGQNVPGGPSEGHRLRSFDIGVILGMEYAIDRRWSIDLRGIKGVRDVTYPSAGTFVTNRAIQLAVKYDLTKEKLKTTVRQ